MVEKLSVVEHRVIDFSKIRNSNILRYHFMYSRIVYNKPRHKDKTRRHPPIMFHHRRLLRRLKENEIPRMGVLYVFSSRS